MTEPGNSRSNPLSPSPQDFPWQEEVDTLFSRIQNNENLGDYGKAITLTRLLHEILEKFRKSHSLFLDRNAEIANSLNAAIHQCTELQIALTNQDYLGAGRFN